MKKKGVIWNREKRRANEGKILKVKEKLGLICKSLSLRIFPTKENEVIVLILGEGEDPSRQTNGVEVKDKDTIVGCRRLKCQIIPKCFQTSS